MSYTVLGAAVVCWKAPVPQ